MLLSHLPADSALARARHGAEVEWTLGNHLLALTVDALAAANWQRAVASGVKPRPKSPAPIPRPGIEDGKTRIGKTDMSPGQVIAWLRTFDPPEEVPADVDRSG